MIAQRYLAIANRSLLNLLTYLTNVLFAKLNDWRRLVVEYRNFGVKMESFKSSFPGYPCCHHAYVHNQLQTWFNFILAGQNLFAWSKIYYPCYQNCKFISERGYVTGYSTQARLKKSFTKKTIITRLATLDHIFLLRWE